MTEPVVIPAEFKRPPRKRRNLEERVLGAFPAIYRLAVRTLFPRLSPRSRLRRVLLRRHVLSGWAAINRSDFELVLTRYAPDVVIELHSGIELVDVTEPTHGRDEALDVFRSIQEGLEWPVFPAAIVDRGNAIVVLGRIRTSGPHSGIAFDDPFSQVATLGSDGLVVRDELYRSWEEGLRAAGLDPSTLDLPPQLTT